MRYYLYLTNDIPGKGWGLHLLTERSNAGMEFSKNFVVAARQHLSKDSKWFHQSSCDYYNFFEFWTDKQDIILDTVIELATNLNLDLSLGKDDQIIKELIF